MELLIKYWTPIWSIMVTLGLFAMALLSKTYARHEHVAKLKQEVEKVKTQIQAMPSTSEFHKLNLEMCSLSGDLKALKPQLDNVEKLLDLLVENELKEKG